MQLSNSDEDFLGRLEKPRAFAGEVGAKLGEYLARALSQRATLTEPKDLAWLLASYARDALQFRLGDCRINDGERHQQHADAGVLIGPEVLPRSHSELQLVCPPTGRGENDSRRPPPWRPRRARLLVVSGHSTGARPERRCAETRETGCARRAT